MSPGSVGRFRYMGPVGEGSLKLGPLIVHSWTDGDAVVTVQRPTREVGTWQVQGHWRASVLYARDFSELRDLGEHPDEAAAVGAAERWMEGGGDMPW